MKKKLRILIASCALGLSAVTAVGGTYAWWTLNTETDSDGLAIEALTPVNLYIRSSGDGLADDENWTNSVKFNTSLKKLPAVGYSHKNTQSYETYKANNPTYAKSEKQWKIEMGRYNYAQHVIDDSVDNSTKTEAEIATDKTDWELLNNYNTISMDTCYGTIVNGDMDFKKFVSDSSVALDGSFKTATGSYRSVDDILAVNSSVLGTTAKGTDGDHYDNGEKDYFYSSIDLILNSGDSTMKANIFPSFKVKTDLDSTGNYSAIYDSIHFAFVVSTTTQTLKVDGSGNPVYKMQAADPTKFEVDENGDKIQDTVDVVTKKLFEYDFSTFTTAGSFEKYYTDGTVYTGTKTQKLADGVTDKTDANGDVMLEKAAYGIVEYAPVAAGDAIVEQLKTLTSGAKFATAQIYVWYDGPDTDCKNENVTTKGLADITIGFKANVL